MRAVRTVLTPTRMTERKEKAMQRTVRRRSPGRREHGAKRVNGPRCVVMLGMRTLRRTATTV